MLVPKLNIDLYITDDKSSAKNIYSFVISKEKEYLTNQSYMPFYMDFHINTYDEEIFKKVKIYFNCSVINWLSIQEFFIFGEKESKNFFILKQSEDLKCEMLVQILHKLNEYTKSAMATWLCDIFKQELFK